MNFGIARSLSREPVIIGGGIVDVIDDARRCGEGRR